MLSISRSLAIFLSSALILTTTACSKLTSSSGASGGTTQSQAAQAISSKFQTALLNDGFSASDAATLAAAVQNSGSSSASGIVARHLLSSDTDSTGTVVGTAGANGATGLAAALAAATDLTPSQIELALTSYVSSVTAVAVSTNGSTTTSLSPDLAEVTQAVLSGATTAGVSPNDIGGLISSVASTEISGLNSLGVASATLTGSILPAILGTIPQGLSNANVPATLIGSVITGSVQGLASNFSNMGFSSSAQSSFSSAVANSVGGMAQNLGLASSSSGLSALMSNVASAVVAGLTADIGSATSSATISGQFTAALQNGIPGVSSTISQQASQTLNSTTPPAMPTMTPPAAQAPTTSSTAPLPPIIVSAYSISSANYVLVGGICDGSLKVSITDAGGASLGSVDITAIGTPIPIPFALTSGSVYELTATCTDSSATQTSPVFHWAFGGLVPPPIQVAGGTPLPLPPTPVSSAVTPTPTSTPTPTPTGTPAATPTATPTGSVTLLNLHPRQVVHTGFASGTMSSGTTVGCQFDGGSINSAISLSSTTWSCALPHGSNTWRLGSTHTIRVGALSAGTLFDATAISVTKGNITDINGDGYADLVIGADAPSSDTIIGSVYLYYGGSNGISATPATTLSGAAGGEQFGTTVAMGDFNGDGYADVVVGATEYSSGGKGAVFIYNGGPNGVSATPTTTLTGSTIYDDFGWSLAVGDVNGDGYADLAVASIYSSSSTVYLYDGAAGGLSTTASTTLTESSNETFGYSLAIGDVNGDGYADVVIGAVSYSGNTGAVYIYDGASGGVSSTATTTLTGSANGDYFGYSVAVGDVNGDGYADIVVGSDGYSSNTGQVFIYEGGSSGPSATASTTLTGFSSGETFGAQVAIGDVNGDGYADVIVAAPRYNSYSGAVYTFLGGEGGVSTTVATTLLGSGTEELGWAVTATDLNGNGYDDLILGVPAIVPSGAVYSGVVSVYDGGSGGIPTTATTTLTSPGNFFGSSIR